MGENNLFTLWSNLRGANKKFTRTFDEFKSDMQDEGNRRRLWGNLPGIFNGFNKTYEEFSFDMGFYAPSQERTAETYQAAQQAANAAGNHTGKQRKLAYEIDEVTRPQDYEGEDSFYNISDEELDKQIADINKARNEKQNAVREEQKKENDSFLRRLSNVMYEAQSGVPSTQRDEMVAESIKLDPKTEERYNRLINEKAYRRRRAGSEYEELGYGLMDAADRVKKARETEGGNLDTAGADAYLQQAIDLYQAPSTYGKGLGIKNWAIGIADQATNYDTYTAGITEMARAINLNALVNKLNDGDKLTEREEAELEAFMLYGMVNEARAEDLSMGYTIGKGTIESVPFMAEMFLTAGIGAASKKALVNILVKSGKRQAAQRLARMLGDDIVVDAVKNRSGNIVNKIALKKAKQGLAEKGLRQVGDDVLMTAFMPTTWAQVNEDAVDEKLYGDGDYDFQDFLRTFAGATIETGTEHWGGKLIDKGFSKIMPIDRIWGKTRWGKLFTNDFIQSPFGETGEEYLGAIANYLRSFDPIENYDFENGEWKKESADLREEAYKMFSIDGFIQTFLTVLPMSGVGGAINVTVSKKNLKAYQRSKKELTDMLEHFGATSEQAANIVMQIESAEDSRQFAERLAVTEKQLLNEWMKNNPNATEEQKKEVARAIDKQLGIYMKSAAYLNEMSGEIKAAYDELDDEKKDKVAADFAKLITERVKAADERIKAKKAAKVEKPIEVEKPTEVTEEKKEPEVPVGVKSEEKKVKEEKKEEPKDTREQVDRDLEVRIDGAPVKVKVIGKVQFDEDGSIDFDANKNLYLLYANGNPIPSGQTDAVRDAVNTYLIQEKMNGDALEAQDEVVEQEPVQEEQAQEEQAPEEPVEEKTPEQIEEERTQGMYTELEAAVQQNPKVIKDFTPEQRFIWNMYRGGIDKAIENAESAIKTIEEKEKDPEYKEYLVGQWQALIDKYKKNEENVDENLVDSEKSSTFAVNITQNAGETDDEGNTHNRIGEQNEEDRQRVIASFDVLRNPDATAEAKAEAEKTIEEIQERRKAQMQAVIEDVLKDLNGVKLADIKKGIGVYQGANGEVVEYTFKALLDVEEGSEENATAAMAMVAEITKQDSFIMNYPDGREGGWPARQVRVPLTTPLSIADQAILTDAFSKQGLGLTITDDEISTSFFPDEDAWEKMSDEERKEAEDAFVEQAATLLNSLYNGNAETGLLVEGEIRRVPKENESIELGEFRDSSGRVVGTISHRYNRSDYNTGEQNGDERDYSKYYKRQPAAEEGNAGGGDVQATYLIPEENFQRAQENFNKTEAAMSAPANLVVTETSEEPVQTEEPESEEYTHVDLAQPDIVIMRDSHSFYVPCRRTEDGKIVRLNNGKEVKGKTWQEVPKRLVKIGNESYYILETLSVEQLKHYNKKGGMVKVQPVDNGPQVDMPIADMVWGSGKYQGKNVFVPSEERLDKSLKNFKELLESATSIEQVLNYPLYEGFDKDRQPIKVTLKDLIETGYHEVRRKNDEGETYTAREWEGKNILDKLVQRLKIIIGEHADSAVIRNEIKKHYGEAVQIWNAVVEREKLDERMTNNTSDFVGSARNSVLTDGKVDLNLPVLQSVDDLNKAHNPLEKIRDARRAIEALLKAEEKQGGTTTNRKRAATDEEIARMNELRQAIEENKVEGNLTVDELNDIANEIKELRSKAEFPKTKMHIGTRARFEKEQQSRDKEQGLRIVRFLKKKGINISLVSEEEMLSFFDEDYVELLRENNSIPYGVEIGGHIYLLEDYLDANSPIHEYTHLFVDIFSQKHQEKWKEIVDVLKQTLAWKDVLAEEEYQEIWDNEYEVASEVLSRLTGDYWSEEFMGKTRLEDSLESKQLEAKVRSALRSFWESVCNLLGFRISRKGKDFDRKLKDILNLPIQSIVQELTEEEERIKEEALARGNFMQAPDGTPTSLTEKQWCQVRTESFKKWFGNSVVVNEHGEPKVVYRGSKNPNSYIFHSKYQSGAIWFTDSREVAEHYARINADHELTPEELEERVHPVFLIIEDAETIDVNGRTYGQSVENPVYMVEDETGEKNLFFKTREEAEKYCEDNGISTDEIYESTASGDVADAALESGKDGVVFENMIDGNTADGTDVPSTIYVTKSSNQAKSATINSGEFDGGNPDIRFHIGDAEILEDNNEPLEPAEKMSWFQKKVNAALDQANGIRLMMKKIGEVEGEKVSMDQDVREALEAKTSKVTNTLNRFGMHQRRHLKKALRTIRKSMKDKGLWKKGMSDYYVNSNGVRSDRPKLTIINVLDMYLQAKDTLERLSQGKKVRDTELCFRLLQYLGMDVKTELKTQEQRNAVLQAMVDKFESTLDEKETKDLWYAINECTRFTLDKMHEGNLIGTNVYEELRKSQFYVPERGFAQLESDEDVRNDLGYGRTRKKGITPDAMKKAEGGESMATDVIANILHLATNAVACAEENKVRQAAFNLLKNHPEACRKLGYPEAERVWYIRDGFNEDGTPRYRASLEKPSTEIISQNQEILNLINSYREDLKLFPDNKAMQEIINQKIEDTKSELLIVPKRNAGGAAVSRVALAGEEVPKVLVSMPTEDGDVQQYTMIFPNQPEIANALNGVLNNKFNDSWMKTVGHRFSSLFTTYNPLFWSRNLPRDVLFVLQKGTAERGAGYAPFFAAEMARPATTMLPIIEYVMGLDVEGRRGNGAFAKDGMIEREFQKFLDGGGNTGFTQMKDIQAFRNEADRLVNGENPVGASLGFIFGEVPAALNEFSELWTRFAVYRATKAYLAMENGLIKTLGRASADWKRTKPYSEDEIEAMALHDSRNFSTNFNRRGAGGFIDFFNSISMFANASIQGAMTTYRTFEKGEWQKGIRGGLSLMIVPALLGYLLTMMRPDGDDNDKVPDYIRQNNLVFLDKRVPLSYELVPWYRIGVNYAMMEQGRMSKTDGVENIVMGFAEHALPTPPAISSSLKEMVDMAIPETDFNAKNPNFWQAMLPLIYGEFANPFMELSHGKNWTGSNLRYEYAKDTPQWMHQEYESELYKSISKQLYEWAGGDMDNPSITVKGKKMNDFENMSPKEVKNIIGSVTPNGWVKIACYAWGLTKDNIREQDVPLKSDFTLSHDAEMARIGISAEMGAMIRDAKENYTRVPVLRDMDEKDANRKMKDWDALYKDYTNMRLKGDEFTENNLQAYKQRLERKWGIRIDGDSKEELLHAYIIVMTNEEIEAKGLERTIEDMERWRKKYDGTPTYGIRK